MPDSSRYVHSYQPVRCKTITNWYSAFLVNDASQKNCRGLLLGKTCRGRNFFQLFLISFPNASKFWGKFFCDSFPFFLKLICRFLEKEIIWGVSSTGEWVLMLISLNKFPFLKFFSSLIVTLYFSFAGLRPNVYRQDSSQACPCKELLFTSTWNGWTYEENIRTEQRNWE